ncbi:MAG: thiamine diphosphokinase [Verrucomicrobia bacterium]|nr:thiamine diphosphokinase [Verrucomicrobiota bacterium]
MFKQSLIAIICSAPIADLASIKEKIIKYPVLIAVDGGVNYCYEMGLQPDLILGDLDSADPHLLKAFSDVPTKRFPRDKDETDLQLALEIAFHPAIEEIAVFGALGGRTDHTLGNLILLTRYPGKVFLETETERVFVVQRQAEFATEPGQTISLIPLNGPVRGITTEGLKWALKDGSLDKHFIGVSNEATGSKVSISVKDGDLLCCVNH